MAGDNMKDDMISNILSVKTEGQIASLDGLENVASAKFDFFEKGNFHVDKFVAECKDQVSLQMLREELEDHYKNIRLALIDLINKDYADFVSLSSSLVGTEKSIENLRQPLGSVHEEVEAIKKQLSNELESIDNKLLIRRNTREKKVKLQHLLNASSCVEKIEKIIMSDSGCIDLKKHFKESRESVGQFLERVAGEFNQLQFHVSQCKRHPLVNLIRPRVSLITSKLQENLETTFREGLAAGQSDLVTRCLRTYSLIDKTGHAEDLFRHEFVKPKLESLISEASYNAKGLNGICQEIIKFVKLDCQLLLALTTENSPNATAEKDNDGVKGFDFLVNAIWPEVDHGFESRLSFIFSPGNPSSFFERYGIMMEFLEEFETTCTSLDSFKRLRAHSGYHSFLAKWSLPIYFQIRLQEIGRLVEAAFDNPLQIVEESSMMFTTNVINAVWDALNTCWDEKVILLPLASRFWKLSLQIVSRLATYLDRIFQKIESSGNENDNEVGTESESETADIIKHDVAQIGQLYGDLQKLKIQMHVLLQNTVKPYLRKVCGHDTQQQEATFEGSSDCLSVLSEKCFDYCAKTLANACILQLESAKNIPRLYRRTNKEQPLDPSLYIKAAFSPLKVFCDSVQNSIEHGKLSELLQKTMIKVMASYHNIIHDLVASIKKTEESLQRLKRFRKGVESNPQPSSDVSDENKIRQQLLLDVEQFGREMKNMVNDDKELSDKFSTLNSLVLKANQSF